VCALSTTPSLEVWAPFTLRCMVPREWPVIVQVCAMGSTPVRGWLWTSCGGEGGASYSVFVSLAVSEVGSSSSSSQGDPRRLAPCSWRRCQNGPAEKQRYWQCQFPAVWLSLVRQHCPKLEQRHSW